MKNIGIFGIGAIGSLITKYIIRNPVNRYFFFNRSEKETINIKFKDQEESISIELSNHQTHHLDWLIVCLKEYQVQQAIPRLKELIKPTTNIAIFQNGIKLSKPYVQFTNPVNLLETVIDCPIQRIGQNNLIQVKRPKIILPQKQLANEFIQLFKDDEIEFLTADNFIETQWIKLIESSAIGSVQASTGKPCAIFQKPAHLKEFMELVDEGIKVAVSEGITINKNLKNQLLIKLKKYPKTKGSSMLTDKLAGNKLELDAKIGIILKIADSNKISVPTTHRIYNALVNS